MREELQNILDNYLEARKQEYTGHELADLVRHTIPSIIKSKILDPDRYLIKGSAGAGNWTTIPWIAIFDILVTKTAQSGYYPVFLFKDDMTGVYISLNQGVTEIKEKYKTEAKQVLKLKAEDFRAQLGKIPINFSQLQISLRSQGLHSSLAELYEAGNIFAKYYSSRNLPSNEELFTDINKILKIYEELSYNEVIPPSNIESEYEEEYFKGYENLKRFRFHKRIERNNQLSKKVKATQGYTCKACKINFEIVYGDLGKCFIEAHHLVPISSLVKNKVLLDVRKDFTVLCSNCHSMIHRLDDPSDLDLLISILEYNSH